MLDKNGNALHKEQHVQVRVDSRTVYFYTIHSFCEPDHLVCVRAFEYGRYLFFKPEELEGQPDMTQVMALDYPHNTQGVS